MSLEQEAQYLHVPPSSSKTKIQQHGGHLHREGGNQQAGQKSR